MTSVTFPTLLGGDGSTVTDDSNASTGLGNGGHRYRFLPSLVNLVAMCQTAVNAANTAVTSPASLSATSTTSLAIGTGSKSLTLAQTGKGFNVNSYVTIASTANPANFMFGQITAFTAATGAMTVNVLSVGGSGTLASWSINNSQPNFSLYNPSNGSLSFYFDGNNIALGGTTYPWAAGTKALEFGYYGVVANISTGSFYFGQNTYTNGANWIAKTTGAGTLYSQSTGTHYWYSMASVAAGATQSLAQTMSLDASGNANIAGTVTAGGFSAPGYTATGSAAIISFQDRATTTNYWSWYSTGSIARLYSGIAGFVGDKLTIDSSGNLSLAGTMSGASLTNGTVAASKLAAGAAVSNIGPGGITPSLLSTGAPTWDASGNLQFNSGYGSVATAYGCRAWVNFNGTGTVAIRASGNVSSITDNGEGNYTINFATAMPDANYNITTSGSYNNTVAAAGNNSNPSSHPISSSSCAVFCSDGALNDMQTISVAIFR